ncbi:outer membrane protein assembly factor BamE (lipoprotein component of BamABCDE complex) [Rhodovulum iodosum]|uniref:Outer membrane protein assembly factor BamE (Lipoprotein component of BamABCDE complex) n=1 Tax=Rhodovulum iodosum TaxID=68291 RepID=A0ABV3XVQ8_9RHOB|nr:outer membrane protein assembly factor BamE [Rhodovulum robiginosum]RSK39026.1 outer membrane protein assembly factor BamE [Rhodovulum robiginosum]
MQQPAGVVKLALAVALALGLSACSPIYRNHGYAPTESELSEIVVGIDSRDAVAELVGPPATSGMMRDDAWYYVASRWRTVAYRAPELIERQVVAVSFDDDGTVANIERYAMEDGRVIALNRRVTDDNVAGISFIRQLLGNIGNFDAGQFLGE